MTQSPIVGARAASPVNAGGSAGQPGHEPALKDVLVELWQNLEKLVRQEIALASAELAVKAQKLKGEVASVAVGAGLMLAGTLALVAAIILLLALFMPAWVASLITGAVAAGAGFAVVKAKKPTAADVTPERTLQNLKKDLRTFTEPSK
jgi:Putative Actinobacterial Holin-X, holin superfamily III